MLKQGDCKKLLTELKADSIDSLITDPPAGISFMGKDWDSDRGGKHQWIFWMTEVMLKVFSVLKPGAHGLVWALPRTSHWTAMSLENAGFEVRDVVTHLFGSGFPKSHDVSKALDKAVGAKREILGKKTTFRKPQTPNGWDCTSRAEFETAPSCDLAKQYDGWGTALKPASEHWILIRKPLSEKTIAKNFEKWGVGGINIDESRIKNLTDKELNWCPQRRSTKSHINNIVDFGGMRPGQEMVMFNPSGRFPANLVLDEEAAEMLGEPSRFFYCAKASKKDRNEGLEGMEEKNKNTLNAYAKPSEGRTAPKNGSPQANHHPCVKNTKLMEYLIKLITPAKGKILDPFMGSGSTGVAAKRLGFEFIGIEMDKEYFEIAQKRIGAI